MIIKNKLAHIIFQTCYCVLGIIGITLSLGYLDRNFNTDFYVYYTNLSNYICFGFMIYSLIFSIKHFNDEITQKDNIRKFKFMCLIMILVTLLVYNFLLTGGMTFSNYIFSLSNILLHLILPLMFILDWILFDTHGKVKWYYPLLSVIMPLIYVAFILIRASILTGKTSSILYPYFFLNLPNLGITNFILWLMGLVAVFLIIGYLFYFFDNIYNFTYFKKVFNKKNNSK